MPELTINVCEGFYETKNKKFALKCDKKKAIRLSPDRFSTWLEDRKKQNKLTIMIMGVK